MDLCFHGRLFWMARVKEWCVVNVEILGFFVPLRYSNPVYYVFRIALLKE